MTRKITRADLVSLPELAELVGIPENRLSQWNTRRKRGARRGAGSVLPEPLVENGTYWAKHDIETVLPALREIAGDD